MDRFIIEGGRPLRGTVAVSGSKNAALPLIAAAILGDSTSVLRNVPDLRDVRTMLSILQHLGASVRYERGTLEIDPTTISSCTAPYEYVSTMRGSICLLGPLLARFGEARFSMPGGCVIGPRPIDLHLKGLSRLGVRVTTEEGYIVGRAEALVGNTVFLGGTFGSSVLATANVMMAATLASGETSLEFAACEPEIQDLASFLVKMGASIEGGGTHCVRIRGVRRLHGAEHEIIPDRIEAGTFLLAGVATRGDVCVERCEPAHLTALLDLMEQAGCSVSVTRNCIRARLGSAPGPVDVVTLPYPGFPTDLQAQMMAFLTRANGVSVITEKVFPERFIHAAELNRLGAQIALDGPKAIVRGVPHLQGAQVMASDLRASAALVIAGLCAEGTTTVSRVYHLDRGYERFEEKLAALGGRIVRAKEEG